jgi:hypothetical protein
VFSARAGLAAVAGVAGDSERAAAPLAAGLGAALLVAAGTGGLRVAGFAELVADGEALGVAAGEEASSG